MSAVVANASSPSRSPSHTSNSIRSGRSSGQDSDHSSVHNSAPAPNLVESGDVAEIADLTLDAVKDYRKIIRLLQCRVCSGILQKPVTTPCGRSLCQSCLPETHVRHNISWPATTNWLEGFTCPFEDCGKEHALGACNLDVTLAKAIDLFDTALNAHQGPLEQSGFSVHVTALDEWQVAGIPSLAERDGSEMIHSGSRLLATYMLVKAGQLKYETETSYAILQGDNDALDAAENTTFTKIKDSVRTEMDCQVCHALFLDPLTTNCGHTFCRSCVRRFLDHSTLCPICRRSLALQAQASEESTPPNLCLTKMLNGFWADDLAARVQALRLEQQASHGGFDIPIFVCTLSFPRMPTFLHVFEPRYRLMMRRAMEADRIFGMVLFKRHPVPGGPHFEELGTLLRIVNLEYMPDGRSLVETIGVSRFRVTRSGLFDGYIVGNVARIDDISVEEEEAMEIAETTRGQGVRNFAQHDVPYDPENVEDQPPPTPISLEELNSRSTQELVDIGIAFVRRMQHQSVSWLVPRILAIYGDCPTDPATFPWWLGSILPVRDEEKYRLLSTTSVRERLKICCRWIIEWESSRWSVFRRH
ncbi:ATP-dependent protease La domain-containing protein [Microdochium trichocladiopsis]|uniref:ATP-dependent protease La domain-containing protein n=1 Tax=Microdochium trichocladiopsis TaxID=1682393 RepID=A0A9P9C0D9_9PEZI|nr:ATP-dependent protease La domain-containing protein [Microdochium trichocladiopsis]KAH7041024.1 ATP-dependent protease La domain-containing protein [Microdochium trichocladiopsis]